MTYIPSSEEEKKFLEDFDPSQYKHPAVAADTALFALDGETLKVLLIKRGGYPCKDWWALPGGFVDIDEDIRKSAERELFEETGISNLYLEQVFVWGRPDRDPRQRVITVSYVTLAEYSKLNAMAGDDAAEAEWFDFKDYTKNDSDGFTTVKYTLSGPEVMHPEVKFPYGRMQEISCVDSDGLAFDHAESIAYSFEYLKQRIRDGAFLEFAIKKREVRKRIKTLILDI